MHKRFILLGLVFLSALAASCGRSAPDTAADETAKQEIRRVLEKWPNDFNAKDKDGTCALFAADLVASYPGQPDKNYEAMCKHLSAALQHPDKTFHYDAPQIQEILVSGDLAVVRLIWTLRVTDRKGEAVVKEQGIDVLKRQQDGSWKVSISHAYPEPEK
jgi:uncharacterized protein (TIGR02246 family)